MHHRCIFFFLLLVFYVKLGHGEIQPTVCLEDSGDCYRGSWSTTKDIGFASFQGIRYAQPPIGDLRFKPPQPLKQPSDDDHSNNNVFHDVSIESKVKCPQLSLFSKTKKGQEDCLMLNIYVPEVEFSRGKRKLPVMVWIHGGALLIGSNNYNENGPKHFMKKEIVMVTVNYRLGPLGFLSMGTDSVPGNVGLRDQNMALKWVKQNIAAFGGDPNSVTLFGESAGSLSVSLHLISPMSQGLFHRIILQSGTALAPAWGPINPQHALYYRDLFLEKMECHPGQDVVDPLTCLQDKPLKKILASTDLMDKAAIWMPVPDANFTSEPFLPGYPEDLMSNGEFNTDIEVIIGTTADEGIIYLARTLLSGSWGEFKTRLNNMGPKYLFNIANKSEVTNTHRENVQKIIEFYIGASSRINEEDEDQQELFDMFTDATFLYGTYKTVNYLVKHNVSVFQYILSYEGDYSFVQLYGIWPFVLDPLGVCHGDDLIYLWDPVFNEKVFYEDSLENKDAKVREIMISSWTNFASFGNPTPSSEFSKFNWTTSIDFPLEYYLDISGPEPMMKQFNDNIIRRMKFWETLEPFSTT